MTARTPAQAESTTGEVQICRLSALVTAPYLAGSGGPKGRLEYCIDVALQ